MSEAIKRLPLHEKNPAKIIDSIEKTIGSYDKFQKTYRKDGMEINKNQLEKEYSKQKNNTEKNSLSR